MEARGEKGTGTIGDILALRAQIRGAATIITDGGVRDFAAVSALDAPTYYANPLRAVLGRRHIPWDTDITIVCGGAPCSPAISSSPTSTASW
jgi:5-oxopent-3-ene-1,2,5-tricarboxylate decarboxylase/2-hydroxyhepta-2,4-diene-1,7-dioate isomerase